MPLLGGGVSLLRALPFGLVAVGAVGLVWAISSSGDDPPEGPTQEEIDAAKAAAATAAAIAAVEAMRSERIKNCGGITNFFELDQCCKDACDYEGGGEDLDYSPYRCTGEAGAEFADKVGRYTCYHTCMSW